MAEFFDMAVREPLLSRVPQWIHPDHVTMLRAAMLAPLVTVPMALRTTTFAPYAPAVSVGIVILSSVCDLLDGPLARARGIDSNAGGTLDATCDKIFVIGALWTVCLTHVAFWQVICMTAIDLLLTVIRPFKSAKRGSTYAKAPGAVKVWLQSVGICLVLTEWFWASVVAPYVFVAAILAGALSLGTHLRDIFAPVGES